MAKEKVKKAAALSRSAQLGIRVHAPVRRSSSKGGCDFCGDPLDSDVHNGELQEVDGEAEMERAVAAAALFQRHKDGTLCSNEDCERAHVGAKEE